MSAASKTNGAFGMLLSLDVKFVKTLQKTTSVFLHTLRVFLRIFVTYLQSTVTIEIS